MDKRYKHAGVVLDAGKYEKVMLPIDLAMANPQPLWRREIIRINGQPTSTDVPLDGQGRMLLQGAAPVFLTFKKYWEIDFSTIIDYPSVSD